MKAIRRSPAPVRPRYYLFQGGGQALLEDAVEPLLDGCGTIEVIGRPGMGKTTALRHLAHRFADRRDVALLDRAGRWVPEPKPHPKRRRGVLIRSVEQAHPGSLATFVLAPWTADEWIEYLMNVHPGQCASVMARLGECDRGDAFEGIPELWRPILDRMAADPAIPSPQKALALHLTELAAGDDFLLMRAAYHCLDRYTQVPPARLRLFRRALADTGGKAILRLIRHGPLAGRLAAGALASELSFAEPPDLLDRPWSPCLYRDAAPLLATDGAAQALLRRVLAAPATGQRHTHAASLLHAMNVGWRPGPGLDLQWAKLSGANWPSVDLTGSNLYRAWLEGANLEGADLRRCCLREVEASHSHLEGANLEGGDCRAAQFEGSSLRNIQGEGCAFDCAQLAGVYLSGARLGRASLARARLTLAVLRDADLSGADLSGAQLDWTDFRGANLSGAILRGLSFSEAQVEGARFDGAHMAACDLGWVSLEAASFRGADLSGAILTGSRLPGADFRDACLERAGLAGIDWEGADLRGADLREANFQLYAAPKTRQARQERRANLRGADLRGARVDRTDFRGVDLGAARYDAAQAEHFRRCEAILE